MTTVEPALTKPQERRKIYIAIKRLFDLVFSIAALVVLAPLFPVIAIIIRFDSPGPTFFCQPRIGRGSKPFSCYKFRSMVHHADQTIYEQFLKDVMHNRSDDSNQDNRDVPFRLKANWVDTRITRVGRWLRITSLDELPQLFNVLRGEMSIIGPRPDVPLSVEGYTKIERRRLEVLPGITGLWQVSGRANLTVRQMFELDVRYVEEQSLWLDFQILIKTIPAVLRREGAG